jgi:hypothetical protein
VISVAVRAELAIAEPPARTDAIDQADRIAPRTSQNVSPTRNARRTASPVQPSTASKTVVSRTCAPHCWSSQGRAGDGERPRIDGRELTAPEDLAAGAEVVGEVDRGHRHEERRQGRQEDGEERPQLAEGRPGSNARPHSHRAASVPIPNRVSARRSPGGIRGC